MNALRFIIAGDSQAQATGTQLAKVLAAQGHSGGLKAWPGASTAALLGHLQAAPPARADLLVIFTGGNNDANASQASLNATMQQLVALGQGARVVVIGPPPATRITNVAYAQKVFGKKAAGPEAWFTTGIAANRERANAAVAAAAKASGAKFVDWRKLGLAGELQPSGVTFPSSVDGIHVLGEAAQASAEAFAGPVIGTTHPLLIAGGIAGGVLAAVLIGRLVYQAITARG